MFRLRILLPICALLIGSVLGCSDDNTNAPKQEIVLGEVVPDFTITDVNATSATLGTGVSPRQHLQKVSAWYFGHAT